MLKKRPAAETAALRRKLRVRLLDLAGLSMDGWLKSRFGKKKGYMSTILGRHLGKETYPREASKAYRIIKALEKDTGLKLCG